jgi:mannosyltransferase
MISKASIWSGSLVILAGLLVPSPAWLTLLRGQSGLFSHELLQGALLFRAGLCVLGAAAILLARRKWVGSSVTDGSWRPSGYGVALLVLLFGSFLIRLYQLDSGLWLDEILTYVQYSGLPYGEIVTTYTSENQHFLFTLLTRACFDVFGAGPWALRLPAVLFGVASIGALYLFGREVIGPREALLSSALLAFSYHHVWFSQNARGYSGLLFWTLFSSWLLMKGLREGRALIWIAYALAVALGVYTHITMLFVAAGQFAAWGIELYLGRRRVWPARWNGFWLGFVMAGLFTFQLYAIVLPQVRSSMARTVSVVEAWKKPLWTIVEIFSGLQTNFAGAAVAAIALVVFAAGLWSFASKNPAVIYLLFLPPVVGASFVLFAGHHLWPRFFFFTFGFGALVTVRGTWVLAEAGAALLKLPPALGPRLASAVCTTLVLVSAASVPFAFGPKQDYLGALAFVEAARSPGDAVVTAGLATFPYQRLYKAGFEPVESLEALNSIRSRAKRTILLYTLEPVLESMYPDILASVKRDFKPMKQFGGTLQGGTVYVYVTERPNPVPPEI